MIDPDQERDALAWQTGVWNRMSDTYFREIDQRFAPVVDALLTRAALRSGDHVIDLGAMVSSDQRDSDRDRYLLIAALLGFGLWLASVGPVRTWATSAGGYWVVGVAPSFLAACTFAFWQAFAVRSRPLASAAYAAALVAATEVIQLFLPGYTADVGDVVAGVAGAAVALPVLLWRRRRRQDRLQRVK